MHYRNRLTALVLTSGLVACGGGGNGATSANASSAGGIPPLAAASAPPESATQGQYSITYISPDAGCTFQLNANAYAASPTLSPTGVIGANEFCTSNAYPRVFVYDHGTRTQLPDSYLYVTSINSSKKALVQAGSGSTEILDLQSETVEPLQGPDPVAFAINDAGSAAGSNGVDCSMGACIPNPARFAPDGTYAFLGNSQGGSGKFINTGGTVAVEYGQTGGVLYEPQGVVNINTVIGQSAVYVTGLNDNNHVALTAGPSGGPAKAYLFTGTSNALVIPPLTPGGTVSPSTVNNDDEVVGTSCAASGGSCQPFVYDRTTATTGTSLALITLAPGLVPAPSFMPISNNGKGEILVGAIQGGQVVLAWLIPHGCINP
jgi:hypothetical protein